ncbi:MAG: taurine dioxygenase [Anderseniella sp.]
MTDRDLTISPLTTAIGAEISGVDLSGTPAAATFDHIYQALIDHLVVFFRDQDITPQQHMAFAQSFGELDEPHPVYAHVPGFERIVMLANDASNPPDTDGWHTDLTFKPNPPFASILVARDVPSTGGDTIWSSMYAAYDALDDGMKAYLADKVAIHEMGDFRNSFTVGETDTKRLNAAMQRFGSALHNVVQVHPVTGRKFLYVNEGFTQHIVGMTTRASNRLLAYLLDHIDRPEYQVRFKWRAESIAMWDNRCTQHYAVSDYMPNYRCMNRITVINDRRAQIAGKSAAA